MWVESLLNRHAVRSPDRIALRDPRRALTWAQLDREARVLAGHISDRVPVGERVVVSSENRVEVLVAYLACALAGAVATPVNSALADPELAYILGYVEPALAIGPRATLARLAPVRLSLELLDIDTVGELDGSPGVPRLDATLDEPFALLHTSATTGHPKAAVLDARSLQVNSLSLLQELRPHDGLVYLHAGPLFHGSMTGALTYLAAGASVCVLDHFTPQGFLAAVAEWRVEHTLMVPSMLRLLLQARGRHVANLSSLELIMHTAEPMPASLRARVSREFGIPLRNLYGITEGGGHVLGFGEEDSPYDQQISGATCVGVPQLGYHVRILREDATQAAPGEVGELCVQGDGVMREYWRRPEATAEALRGGWLHTGDLGYRDARGYLWIVDRRSDLIIRGGQNVYPAEIERVISQSPHVADVAVVAAPSASWGQTPWAFVQPTRTEDFDERELLALAVRELASYKRPSRFVAVEKIPRGPSGKVLRRLLREEVPTLTEITEGPALMTSVETSAATLPTIQGSTRAAIGLVLVAAFMVLMDVSIVNVAAPSIERSLGASLGEVQLVVALYQVAYAAMLVPGGRLGDIVGVRAMFLVGVLLFTAASIACAAAGSPEQLIIFRVLQGASAALMYPQVLATIQILLTPERRAGALAALGVVATAATAFGPLLAGVVIDPSALDASWRIVFLVNIPIGLAALVLGRRLVPAIRRPEGPGLDWTSAVLFALALACLMLPLTVGREHGWPLWSGVCLVAIPLLLGAFIPLQQRRAAAGHPPLIPPGLWRDRVFRTGVALYVTFFIGMIPFFLYCSFVLQFGAGLGPLEAALTLMPYAIGAAISSAFSRQLIPRWGGRRVAITGALICAAGTAVMLFPVRQAQPDELALLLIAPMVVTGAGLGLVIAPLLFVVLGGIRSAEAGAASGLLGTAQQMGGALGVAVLGLLVLRGKSTDSLATMSYGDITEGFALALVAICAVFLISAWLIASLPERSAPAPVAGGARA